MSRTHHTKIKSRLERLNARLGMLRAFESDGKLTNDSTMYPTYTQAKKALKAIPRNVRELYEKSIRLTNKKQVDTVEQRRKDLRATDIPSERITVKKAERKRKAERRDNK